MIRESEEDKWPYHVGVSARKQSELPSGHRLVLFKWAQDRPDPLGKHFQRTHYQAPPEALGSTNKEAMVSACKSLFGLEAERLLQKGTRGRKEI